jgi:hypothetical protein
MQFYQAFDIYQGEETVQYTVNILFCSIDRTDPDSWVLKSPCGESFAIEDEDKARLAEALGL